jgi:hypothetical protein
MIFEDTILGDRAILANDLIILCSELRDGKRVIMPKDVAGYVASNMNLFPGRLIIQLYEAGYNEVWMSMQKHFSQSQSYNDSLFWRDDEPINQNRG